MPKITMEENLETMSKLYDKDPKEAYLNLVKSLYMVAQGLEMIDKGIRYLDSKFASAA